MRTDYAMVGFIKHGCKQEYKARYARGRSSRSSRSLSSSVVVADFTNLRTYDRCRIVYVASMVGWINNNGNMEK